MPLKRVVIAVVVVAAVVIANQTTERARSSSVLGLKVERCSVSQESGTTEVATGSRVVVADPVSVQIAGGKPGARLIPSKKIAPGAAEPIVPVTVSLGLRGSGNGRVAVTMTVHNLSDCPVAVSVGRVRAVLGASPATVVAVRFRGQDRVVLQGGARTTGQALLPVEKDGNWRVEGSTYADVGSAG